MKLWRKIFGISDIEKRVLSLEAQSMIFKEDIERIEEKLINHRHTIETQEVQDEH